MSRPHWDEPLIPFPPPRAAPPSTADERLTIIQVLSRMDPPALCARLAERATEHRQRFSGAPDIVLLCNMSSVGPTPRAPVLIGPGPAEPEARESALKLVGGLVVEQWRELLHLHGGRPTLVVLSAEGIRTVDLLTATG